jgi:hypothetical protein
VVPKADARPHRPIYAEEVREAFQRTPTEEEDIIAAGIDVARKGGDQTVVCFLRQSSVTFHSWIHTTHEDNKERIKSLVRGRETLDVAIDAVGEGSALADYFKDNFGAMRFKNGERANDEDNFRNCWTEALHHAANKLDGLALEGAPQKLREDLFSTARVVSYEEKELAGGDVLQATSKSEIKEHQGRSPDHLDAYLMACWADGAEHKSTAGTLF